MALGVKSQLDELIALCACGDEAGIRDLLHKLKSAARTVGAFELAFQCQAVEQTEHLNQSIVACDALKRLNLAWDRVLPYLAPMSNPNEAFPHRDRQKD